MGQQYPAQPVPAVAGIVIRSDENRRPVVLLIRRANPPSQGEWSLPGGVLELGEMLEAGVVREVLEETGVHVEPVVVIEVLDHIVHDDVMHGDPQGTEPGKRVRFHYVLIDFLCRPANSTVSSQASGASDALDARWVTQTDLPHYGLSARTLRVIDKGFTVFQQTQTAGKPIA